ncbi:type II CRISPR-associated endonuclease Cas1 [Ilyomonas limi]|uniref:CRISPR-associated endonuclease Cas1 n=1 Tax=Ilyomonas limi TaxID=2575867 RepID=A0A4U3LAF1_9BACT|nr:type II CRISPR-associated endonuclease Cas1 [Ilyomonas limi]TKK71649.1 type II CRISPR-associated endonuclease Cas1 [Ilyomonas limi]
MVKRTLYFGNPAYLKTKTEQLVIESAERDEPVTVPIEDIGLLIVDHAQVTITSGLMAKLLEKNVALVTCDATHHPTGLMLNLDGHTLQSKQFAAQLEAPLPVKKQLWQQTVTAKIYNQAMLLKQQGRENKLLLNYAKDVKSGDSENHEAKAAGYYWKNLFPPIIEFKRDRFGMPPNNMLNYGYAVLRAVVARSLVGSGLLPTLGIFHRNQYNAYCLADDIMEPYRPFVDKLICTMVNPLEPEFDLTPAHKKQLLTVPAMDVCVDGEKSPLMVAIQRTTASLAKCFEGKAKKIIYAELE